MSAQVDDELHKWNPYFAAYCTAHNLQPDELSKSTTVQLGRRYFDFFHWMNKAYRAWTNELGVHEHSDALRKYGREAFVTWLNAYALKEAACLSAPSSPPST